MSGLRFRPSIGFRGNFGEILGDFGGFWGILGETEKHHQNQQLKKRPNTIPIFGLGKWLLGESRALKVGINVGLFSHTL